ncbi:bifunctional 2-keto-4-hydroxyglutarate aldolase/2-keto-3-deoxy-6-phosphogluconate aldolase [Candidatus Bathyarchaeota archaeon]|nr:bifunctional 2-keto-4-hydroxyglutarate aldolase/2-keto-3-deoxy-6-phosphogluconate aldolase [Candidatus Bathyarchaeota archaeon]
MNKENNLKRLIDCGVVSIIRVENSTEAVKSAEALRKGGINIIEVSMVTPGALDAIRAISQKFGEDVLVGAGTVLDSETARAAILAGAEFIIGPTLNREVIKVCNRYSKIVIPGALTPTEILTAWELGADIVKVFPARVLGPRYIKDILAPLPQVRLLPTGGVNLENAGEFLKAGAVAIAVGSALVNKKVVKEGKFDIITEKARKFLEVVNKARKLSNFKRPAS